MAVKSAPSFRSKPGRELYLQSDGDEDDDNDYTTTSRLMYPSNDDDPLSLYAQIIPHFRRLGMSI